jgi:S-adenosylhomocysteine hydrolase
MDKSQNYEVKDISLAEQGAKKIEFAKSELHFMLQKKRQFL